MDNQQLLIIKEITLPCGDTVVLSNNGDVFNKKVFGNVNEYLSIISKYNKHYRIHTLIFETFLNLKSDYSNYINHIDGNKHNNNINNLELITSSESSCHMRYILNKSCGRGSLTTPQVSAIFYDILSYKYNFAYEIASKYNVDTRLIRAINKGTKYKYVSEKILNLKKFPINNSPDFSKRKPRNFIISSSETIPQGSTEVSKL